MAAVTLAIEPAGDTNNTTTYATGAFTPAAGDLLVAIAGCSTTVAAGSYLSDDPGKTYSKVTSGICLVAAANSTLYAFVGDQVAAANSQTGTLDVTGDAGSGCAQAILAVSGMAAFGASAVRQFKSVDSGPAGTAPTITFDRPCLDGNPTIMAIYGPSGTNVTAPVGWTQLAAPDHATPTAGIVVWARDSGFSGQTITAGGTFSVGHAIVALELAFAPEPVVRDVVGAGRDWKGLADAEFEIHKIGAYKEKLKEAVEAAPEIKEPDQIPEWLEDFLEEEELGMHVAAMDLLLSQIDHRLEELVKAWLQRKLLDEDEEDAAVMLLLN